MLAGALSLLCLAHCGCTLQHLCVVPHLRHVLALLVWHYMCYCQLYSVGPASVAVHVLLSALVQQVDTDL